MCQVRHAVSGLPKHLPSGRQNNKLEPAVMASVAGFVVQGYHFPLRISGLRARASRKHSLPGRKRRSCLFVDGLIKYRLNLCDRHENHSQQTTSKDCKTKRLNCKPLQPSTTRNDKALIHLESNERKLEICVSTGVLRLGQT